MHSKPIQKIVTFLAFTLALSSIFYYLILSGGSLETAGGLYVLGLMWAPGLAGIITQLVFERSLRGMGWKPGKFQYLAAAFLLPLLYCLVVYGITWSTGLASFPEPALMPLIRERWGGLTASPALQILLTMTLTVLFGLIPGLISSLGEEIGWRGLFVPELAKVTSFGRVGLISGGVWAAWHMPLLLFSDYNLPGAPVWYAAVMFTVMVIGISFAFAWLRLKSGSLWTATLLHAMHNIFVQGVFTPFTERNELTPYIIDEFGIGLALAGLLVALYYWRKRKALPQEQEKVEKGMLERAVGL